MAKQANDHDEVLASPADRLKWLAQQARLAGLGALSTAQKQGSQLLSRLIAEGTQLEAQWLGLRNTREHLNTPNYREQLFEARVQWLLRRLEIPTRDDWQPLYQQLHELEKQISQLQAEIAADTESSVSPQDKS